MGDYPTLTKISEGIYQLVVRYPFGMYEMNSFLFQGVNGFTIVDTGSEAKESIDIWEKTLASGITVDKLVLTHAHPDHIGLAKWFQEQKHVPVYISSLGYKEILRKRKNEDTNWMRRFLKTHGGPEIPKNMENPEAAAYEFEPDGLFEKEQTIILGDKTYEPIWTPGHSSDHFCFYNKNQQVMITGDHVLAGLSPIIAIWSENDENPIKDNFDSLERIKAFSTKIALPGHGELIFSLNNRIDEIISGHKHRLQQILISIENDEKTSWQICQELYGSLSPTKFFAPFLATITRLIYLEKSGEVFSELKDDKLYFRSMVN
ncbi:glyoxylase-like metal-dependent hydrolase (beta-lactamase superfamily II) [Neobacillus niacini]|uniref:MBL fold metallo-hydrolase n=1 Tax=Neobacillus niacini TaxID=86668 RepID=UPI0028588C9E|nr:MBL fold metallo-hydrolase [Neobacillus niacini]MDR7077345.1 glyoxylase-like metal-dependent hydrolase (beta-lactamase superfamily II) [Neobacillus niacini]